MDCLKFLNLPFFLSAYFRFVSTCATALIVTCAFTIPVLVLVYALLRQWIQYRKHKLLPHLRQEDTDGKEVTVVGLFHPYCNAGGGGERVLWTAIRALQLKYPHVRCVVYTGDTNASEAEILTKARDRFNIILPKPIEFVYLHKRNWVEASRYPYFTLLGQSLGSVYLGWEAIMKYVPDVFIDTMGYAFTIPLFKYLGKCKVACYVHYPTISTDMLDRVQQRTQAFNNAGIIAKSPFLSSLKLAYYHLFAYMYGITGKRCHVVMVNSSWTQGHILALWHAGDRTCVVYPPCDTKAFLDLPLERPENQQRKYIVSIAQFRPEKDHPLQINAFENFLKGVPPSKRNTYKLVLIGSSRNTEDGERVENLKKLCEELQIQDHVEFQLNVPFHQLKESLGTASVGLHTMWNEHFGIGVVEMMASGCITLAHNSGGPKMDIVVPLNGQRTGFLADSVETYSQALTQIFTMSDEARQAIRLAARESVSRFSEAEFEAGFLTATEPLFVEYKY